MINRERLISELVDDVRYEMLSSIECGFDYMNFEKDFGKATVCVEVREHRLQNGFYGDDMDVYITHEGNQQSPRLEKAIRAALPNWWDVRREVLRQIA